MFPFNMLERLWYVLLCLISNSQILLPIHSLSLRDGTGIQARVVGNSNGSTVHIVLQRSTAVAEKVCPTGFYEHARPARRTGRSAPATIVGRSGDRGPPKDDSSNVPTENEEEEIVPLKLCLPCTVCEPDQVTKKPCTPTEDTICQTCEIHTDTGPCVRYDQVDISLATNPPRNDKASNVQVTLDFSGKPDGVKADKSGMGSAPQDLNVNILKAGKDERNSWYFLSLCALIGLLVFLSLVMGAYLVSVKVTSWWRYQRPITVRRRGKSFVQNRIWISNQDAEVNWNPYSTALNMSASSLPSNSYVMGVFHKAVRKVTNDFANNWNVFLGAILLVHVYVIRFSII